jgi:hypothetical protein
VVAERRNFTRESVPRLETALIFCCVRVTTVSRRAELASEADLYLFAMFTVRDGGKSSELEN